MLQDTGIKAIGIHARTRAQLYGGKADWTLIGEVKKNPRMFIPVFGNGDIISPKIAKEMKDRYGVDGILIGRAAVGYPWIFREVKQYLATGILPSPPSAGERIKILRRHIEKSLKYKGEKPSLFEMRKIYSGYFRGLPDFKPYRVRLVTASSFEEVGHILTEIVAAFR